MELPLIIDGIPGRVVCSYRPAEETAVRAGRAGEVKTAQAVIAAPTRRVILPAATAAREATVGEAARPVGVVTPDRVEKSSCPCLWMMPICCWELTGTFREELRDRLEGRAAAAAVAPEAQVVPLTHGLRPSTIPTVTVTLSREPSAATIRAVPQALPGEAALLVGRPPRESTHLTVPLP